ncbi:MAG: ComEC/Rec2 family competence protein [Oligoflexales bacterium]
MTWISGFIVGNGVAYYANLSAALLTCVFSAAMVVLFAIRSHLKWKLVVLFHAGFFWGYANNFEVLRIGTTGIESNSYFWNRLRTGMLTVNFDGKTYLTRGIAEVKAKGENVCFESGSILFPCTFVSPNGGGQRPLSLFVQRKVELLSQPIRGWLLAILVGNFAQMMGFLTRAFFSVGIIHLVVISGMHISMLINATNRIFGLILRVFYVFRIIGGTQFAGLAESFRFLAMGLVTIFLWDVGFAPSSQRAVIASCVTVFSSLMFIRARWSRRASAALFVQTLIFPCGFIHPSNFLSWISYTVVYELVISGRFARTFRSKALAVLNAQLKLMFLSFAVTQNLTVISLVMNIVVVPLFPLIFLLGLLSMFVEGFGNSRFTELLLLPQQGFLDAIWSTSQKNDELLGRLQLRSNVLSAAFFGLCIFLLLKTITNIRKMEEPEKFARL